MYVNIITHDLLLTFHTVVLNNKLTVNAKIKGCTLNHVHKVANVKPLNANVGDKPTKIANHNIIIQSPYNL